MRRFSDEEDDDRRGHRERLIRASRNDPDLRHTPYERPRATNTVVVDTLNGPREVGRRLYVGNLSYRTSWQELKDHLKKAGNVVHADILLDRTDRPSGGGIVEFATAEDAARAVRTLQDTVLDGRPIFLREDREDTSIGGSGRTGRVARSPPRLAASNVAREVRYRVGTPVQPLSVPESPFAELLDPYTYGQMYAQYADMMARGDRGAVVEERYAALRSASQRVNSVLPPAPLAGAAPGSGRTRGHPLDVPPGSGKVLYVGNLAYSVTWQDVEDVFHDRGFRNLRAEIKEEGSRSKGAAVVRFDDPQDAARAISEMHDVVLQGRPMDVHYDRFDGH
eukprot:GGOE01061754.1.p1 GENE.GGOE01061754.1~~GGOE01061754.1.p1  ORF type:complete len:336 (+),score=61.46 GGOE01061754.1:66-1073(+)